MNVFRYFLNAIIYFIVMNLVYLTMYFANLAEINVGVIITIWSINPFFNSIADYYLNDEKMHYYHVIGLVSMLMCSIAVCMKDFIGASDASMNLDLSKIDFMAAPL